MSADKKLYLREDVYFEPLFNKWYAWPYLLPPAQSARHMVNTHKRIMKSFVNDYQLHIMAANEPGLAGGEFLNCDAQQVDEIKKQIKFIDNECSDVVAFSEALSELDNMLRDHVSGESLEPLYESVPDCLKGYIELTMDLNHNPGYRLIEPLLYRSQHYKPNLQSISFGLLNRVDERPFVLSTPRLADDNHLQVDVDFNHALIDQISAARTQAVAEDDIHGMFKDTSRKGGVEYMELFTSIPPSRTHQAVETGFRMSYLGHAGFLFETADVSILVDPVITSRGAEFADEVISFSEIPHSVDYVLLTHNHQDHVNFETLLQLRHKIKTVIVPPNNGGTLADPSLKLLLSQFGFNTITIDELEKIEFYHGSITSLPFLGEHGDLNIRSKCAWLVELLGYKIFVGADSSNLEPRMYQMLAEHCGSIDILAIGMECIGAPYTWLYGALHSKIVSKKIKESRRLNGSDFAQANMMVEAFKPGQVYLYALGLEPWYKYFMGIDYDDDSEQIKQSNQMVSFCEKRDIYIKRLYGKETVELG